MTRLVIDTDPGVDDALAIMLACGYPGAKVEAITTVAGNVGLERTTANAQTVLDVLAVPPGVTPIYPGCDRALMGYRVEALRAHGADGLGDSRYPPSTRQVEGLHASLALIRAAERAPGELTLVAIGPLTNVALATCLDPSLPRKYRRLVVMGGAIRGGGHATPSAEFNVRTDPEAAAIVFANWPALTLVSWDTTLRYLIPGSIVRALAAARTSRAELFGRITERGLAGAQQRSGRDGLYMPDPLALAVALEPDIVTHSEACALTVELHGTHTRGQTTADRADRSGRDPKVDAVLELNFDRFLQLLRASVAA